MKFSLSKPLFVEPNAGGSGVLLIKILTCFDMHEWVLSLCFSVAFFFFVQRALLTVIEERTTERYSQLYCTEFLPTVDLTISFINTL